MLHSPDSGVWRRTRVQVVPAPFMAGRGLDDTANDRKTHGQHRCTILHECEASSDSSDREPST